MSRESKDVAISLATMLARLAACVMLGVMAFDLHLMVLDVTAMLTLGATAALLFFGLCEHLVSVIALFRLALEIHFGLVGTNVTTVGFVTLMTLMTFHFLLPDQVY